MRLLVTNIQEFCLHDGPGIRTTVFMKGCSLHCPWCCNPENIEKEPQFFFREANCIAKDGLCTYGTCPFTIKKNTVKDILKNLNIQDMQQCKSGAIGRYGKWYDAQDLYDEIMKDRQFWKNNEGGVTFSGGEPLLQMESLKPLLVRLKKEGIHVGLETALYVPQEAVKELDQYFDFIFLDLKLLDQERCKHILGGDLHLFLSNVELLSKQNIAVCVRHPNITGYTDDVNTEAEIRAFMGQHPTWDYQVLEGHHLGAEKEKSIGSIQSKICEEEQLAVSKNMEEILREIRKLQLIQIEVIKLFVDICNKENLNYYMSAGTMLGAVRHKGYIPWDDDADFMMPRPDYEKFLQIADKYLPKGYSIDNYQKNRDYIYYFSRLYNTENKVLITSAKESREDNIWIDILPIDGMPKGAIARKIHGVRLLAARALFSYSVFDQAVYVNKINRPWFEKILVAIGIYLPIKRLVSKEKRWNALDKALKKYSYKDSDYLINFMGGYRLKEMFSRATFGTGRLYGFEGMLLKGVEDYDTYLKGLYDDYMTPPPEKERIGHTVIAGNSRTTSGGVLDNPYKTCVIFIELIYENTLPLERRCVA